MNEEEIIKEIGAMLPKKLKHKSGKFSILMTDKMRQEIGRKYVEDLKKRLKNE